MSAYLQLKGKQSELRQAMQAMETEFKAAASALLEASALLPIQGIPETRAEDIATYARNMAELKARYLNVSRDLDEVNRSLGETR